MARTRVPDLPPLPNRASPHARKWQEIAAEFVGGSELSVLHALLISHLRKREFPPDAPILFRRLWVEQGDRLLHSLSTRWLISAITTFGDHGATEAERLLGAKAGVLFAAMKIYEAERLYSGLSPSDAHPHKRPAHVEMPMGMTQFSLATGGLDINLLAPIWRDAGQVPVAGPIVLALMGRLNADPGTVFARLQTMRAAKADAKAARQRRHEGPARPLTP